MTADGQTPASPILNAGQTALHVTSLDLRVTTLASFAFAVAMLIIWRPAPGARAWYLLRRRQRRVLRRTVLTLLVVLAVLPSVLPYDHLLPGVAHADSEEQEAVHASHCHVSPGTCSDAPVTAGPGQLIFADPLLLVPAMLAILLVAISPAARGIVPRPDTRPPRVALAA